jgi:hypothetical protein
MKVSKKDFVKIIYGKPFKFEGNTYRLVEGLLVDKLQLKVGARYQTRGLVKGKEDARDVLLGRERKSLK